MARLSKKEVEHIAKLAQLELSEQEKIKFANQLSSILDYVKQLAKVNTSKVEPIDNITSLFNVEREDKVTESLPCEKLLENVPQKENGFIKVGRVKE